MSSPQMIRMFGRFFAMTRLPPRGPLWGLATGAEGAMRAGPHCPRRGRHARAWAGARAPGRRAMKRSALAMTMTVALSACATTEFKSTWKDPELSRLDVAGQKVVAFVLTRNASLRRSAEDALANSLRGRGVNAVAGY